MHEWNSRHDEKSRRRGVRITIPVNLRSSEDDAMPAANVVAMVFIHRGPRWCRDPRRLLISIKARLQFFQRWRLGLAFVRSCAIIGALPGGMAFLTRANRCYTTSVLSNMGRVFAHARLPRREGKIVTGDLTLDAVESAPPVRPYSSASLTCLTYAGKWTLVMNYDRRHFTAKDAKALLATIVRQTRRAAGLSTDLSDAEAEKQRIPV
jgi:hypothetical protein